MRDVRAWYRQFEDGLKPEDSIASYIVRRAAGRPEIIREMFGALSDHEVAQLVYDHDFWARRQQIPPETLWGYCIVLAGRGFGKTWTGSRWVHKKAHRRSIGALIGPTAADVRDTMVRGSSGILALAAPWATPIYEPSKRRVTWPNGAFAVCYSADKPDRLRGPNCEWAWGDEPASWKHEMAALDQLPLILRIGTRTQPPQCLLTGTPRPLKKLEELINRPDSVVVTGSSLANSANLAPSALAAMRAMMGTRWGRQEVLGQLLMDVPGAIFGSAKWARVMPEDPFAYARQLERRIIAVDPAPTSDTGADETGIISMGSRHDAGLKRLSVLKDASLRGSPREWATAAIREYLAWDAHALVVEVNAGGEMVEMVINTVAQEMGVDINMKPVRATAAKSKRAEPISALAETGRIEFVGAHPQLEKQLATFVGINGRRDDRADAFVWGAHELALSEQFWFA